MRRGCSRLASEGRCYHIILAADVAHLGARVDCFECFHSFLGRSAEDLSTDANVRVGSCMKAGGNATARSPGRQMGIKHQISNRDSGRCGADLVVWHADSTVLNLYRACREVGSSQGSNECTLA